VPCIAITAYQASATPIRAAVDNRLRALACRMAGIQSVLASLPGFLPTLPDVQLEAEA
jgi:hypothetical protein